MHKILKNTQNVIWDWNGTLLNDRDICIDSINKLLDARFLTNLTCEQYLDIFTFPVKDYYIKAGFDFQKEKFEEVAVEYMDLYTGALVNCELHNNSNEVLSELKDKGFRQIILSAMEQQQLQLLVKEMGIQPYFEKVYGIHNQLGDGKYEIAKKAYAQSNFSTYNTCIIGDSLHDAEIARYLGVNCILVSHGHQSSKRLKTSGFHVVDNLMELIN